MAKLALSLVLAISQLCSWGGVPVYLCLCDEGAVCIDGGPQQCDCCEHEHAAADACTSACTEHDHEHGAVAASESDAVATLSSPCDCDHVQLSAGGSSPALTRGACESDNGQLVLPHAVALVPASGESDAGQLRLVLLRPPRSASLAATLLGTVVLRC